MGGDHGAAVTVAGVALGSALLYLALWLLRTAIDAHFDLYLDIDPPSLHELLSLAVIVGAGFFAGLLPALRAYRLYLADGMTVRS